MPEGLLTVASFWHELRFWFRSAAITLEMLNKSGPRSPWENCLPCITYFGLLPGPYERLSRRRNPRPRFGAACDQQKVSAPYRATNRTDDTRIVILVARLICQKSQSNFSTLPLQFVLSLPSVKTNFPFSANTSITS